MAKCGAETNVLQWLLSIDEDEEAVDPPYKTGQGKSNEAIYRPLVTTGQHVAASSGQIASLLRLPSVENIEVTTKNNSHEVANIDVPINVNGDSNDLLSQPSPNAYARKPRRPTRADKYEPKVNTMSNGKRTKESITKAKETKAVQDAREIKEKKHKRSSKRRRAALVEGFRAPNVFKERLTVRLVQLDRAWALLICC